VGMMWGKEFLICNFILVAFSFGDFVGIIVVLIGVTFVGHRLSS